MNPPKASAGHRKCPTCGAPMTPKVPKLPFGARAIADLRKSLGLNKTEFGAKIGVTRQTIATWEEGAHKPGLSARMLMDSLRRSVEPSGHQVNVLSPRNGHVRK